MFKMYVLASLLAALSLHIPLSAQQATASIRPVLVLHGGAGNMTRESLGDTLSAQYAAALGAALDSGYAVLLRGGSAMDAVETSLALLEDHPLFNAGKGAVMTYAGSHELDAAIMDGSTLDYGAVAGVMRIQHPIKLARLVVRESPHALLYGKGAEEFAKKWGVKLVNNSYFATERMRRRWFELKRSERDSSDHHGTVGAVALDAQGHLAAGTSTGGLMNKRYNRIGDSPIAGAGTYANDSTCAVSCTGQGEYFMRLVLAKELSAQMAHAGMSLQESAEQCIQVQLRRLGGAGGLIAVDKSGAIAMEYTTAGMFRAWNDGENRGVAIDDYEAP